jgi:hypothetical protein
VSGLADRLVTAAADAIAKSQCERHEEHEYHWHRADGVAAAAAVLRTLAESGQVAWAESLAGLAGVVERGEQA